MLKHFASILCLFLVVGFNSGCTKRTNEGGNIFRMPLKDDVKTLDPANNYDTVSNEVMPMIIESPLQYSYLQDNLVVEPLLADSMPEISKDGLTMTLKIKKGVLFHDDPCFKQTAGKGRELKASDFIFGFKRHALPRLQSIGAWIFEGKVVGFDDFQKKLRSAAKEDVAKLFLDPIEGFELVDDYTIRFRFLQPYPLFNYLLTMGFTAPVPPEAAEMYADNDGNLRDHPVGTGPFVFKSWETNQKIFLAKNPNYHGSYPTTGSERFKAMGYLADAGKKLPFVDGIEYSVIKEDMPRLLQFEKGSLDRIELTKDTFQAAMADGNTVKPEYAASGIQFASEDSLIMWYVGMNVKDKSLSNKLVRQAISSAINREKFIETFYRHRGLKQTQVIPPGIVDRKEKSEIKFDYDVAKAKELLVKAGFPEGKGLPTITFDMRRADTFSRQQGEFFVEQLGAIGIKISVILNTFPAFLEKAKQGNLQLFIGGWNYDYPDAENGFQLLYGPNKAPGPNDTLYENPKFDELYRNLAKMPVGASGRSAIVKQMDDLIQEDAVYALLSYEKKFDLYKKKIKNYRVNETIQNKYKYVRIVE